MGIMIPSGMRCVIETTRDVMICVGVGWDVVIRFVTVVVRFLFRVNVLCGRILRWPVILRRSCGRLIRLILLWLAFRICRILMLLAFTLSIFLRLIFLRLKGAYLWTLHRRVVLRLLMMSVLRLNSGR